MGEGEFSEESPLERKKRIRAMSDVTPSWEHRAKTDEELDPDLLLASIEDEVSSTEERTRAAENNELLQQYSRVRGRFEELHKKVNEHTADRTELLRQHPLYEANLQLANPDIFHSYSDRFGKEQDLTVRGAIIRSATHYLEARNELLQQILMDIETELGKERDRVDLDRTA